MQIRQAVRSTHLVKFCPPSNCTGGRSVAVVEYRLACGHLLRTRHFGSLATRVQRGQSVAPPNGWACPPCTAAALLALQHERCLCRA
jgi:hypothetical protein